MVIGIMIFVTVVVLLCVFAMINNKSITRKFGGVALLLILPAAFIMLLSGMYSLTFLDSSGSDVVKADGFTIDSYKVVLDVKEDYSMDVTEFIGVKFFESGHHGIYRTIPSWLEYTNKIGETNSRKAIISDIRVRDYESEYEEIGHGKKRLRIGSEYETIDVGLINYEISYKYDLEGDIYKGFDEFIFHTFGDYWGTKINNASMEIRLPKKVNLDNKIHFYGDKFRGNDISNFVKYNVIGNTIYINVEPSYNLVKSLTVDIELPDGYFRSSNVVKNTSVFGCYICVIISLLLFILWFIYGKDFKVNNETLSDDLVSKYDSAEIAYLYNEQVGSKSIVSLLIGLADKGIINIENTDDDKVYKITKTGKLNDITDNEREFIEELFKEKKEVLSNEILSNIHLTSSMFKRMSAKFDDVINDKKAYIFMFISALLVVLSTIIYVIFVILIDDIEKKFMYWYYVALVANVFSIIFACLMKRRTEYGQEIKNKIDYIKNNIDSYGNAVAVAFVFGVFSVWASKYKDVNEKLNKAYRDETFVTNFSEAMLPSSSVNGGCTSSGCSSCGGGCSSCGGGGSW